MVKDAAATAAPTQAHSPAAQNGTSLLHSSSPSPSASSALPLLDAADDLYDGKKVSPAALPPPHDTAAFAARLSASLAAWAAAGRRGVWLQLPASHAPFIPVALEQGFVFHHAEKDYVMMTRWLPADEPCTLPPNASHQVGVGSFVVNSRREVLVVQERSGPLRGRGVWKMPTGLLAAGEDMQEGAARELMEETGISARCEAVLALRQAHGFAFGKSDLFVVLGMRPTPDDQQPTHQESELVDARWLPLEEYLQQDLFAKSPLLAKMMERCAAWADGRYRGMSLERLESSVTSRRIDLLVWGEDDVARSEAAGEQRHG